MNKLMTRLAGIGIFFIMAAGGLQGAATNRYVATNAPSPAYPYDSWDNAGTNIIDVVNAANINGAGDIVFVSNGTYYLTNQISVTNNVTVTNFTGDRTKVIINGNYPATTNRCFYLNNGSASVKGFTITNGCANHNDNSGKGGGVYLYNGTAKDCLITGNRSVVTQEYSGGGGGGINIYYGKADSCSVVGNIVKTDPSVGSDLWAGGGGICIYKSTGRATNCYVAYNTASNRIYGGGFFVQGGKIHNCTIANNAAGSVGYCLGGGIAIQAGRDVEIWNCIISSNITTGAHGGGIHLGSSGGTLDIRNCLITYNMVYNYEWGRGAGIYLCPNGSAPVVIDACTIVSNKFTTAGYGYGGGIAFGDTVSYITNVWNCIIYHNYAGKGGANLYDDAGGASKTAVVFSCTSPGSGFNITGVVTSRPSFADTADNNYRLSRSSPCINAGTNRSWMTNGVDLDGHPRIDPFSGMVDMGCYEYLFSGMRFGFR